MEDHAREAYATAASIVEGLVVPQQAALRRPDGVKHRVRRRQPADPPTVAHVGGRPEPTGGVARLGAIEHLAIEATDPVPEAGVNAFCVAELRADVAHVHAAD